MRLTTCRLLLPLVLFGCASREPAPAASSSGSEQTPLPTLASLPGLPAFSTSGPPRVPAGSVRDELVAIRADVERLDELTLPPHPSADSVEAADVWVREALGPWMHERAAGIVVIDRRLDELATAGLSQEERAFAAALSGHAYVDFLRAFFGTPMPTEVMGDPELRDAFAGALFDRVAPLVQTAAQRFAACSGAALDGIAEEVRSYCATEGDAVQALVAFLER